MDSYAVEGARTTDWLAKGVVKRHRTLGTTLNNMIASAIREVHEWHPAREQVAESPALAEELQRPMLLLVSAQR